MFFLSGLYSRKYFIIVLLFYHLSKGCRETSTRKLVKNVKMLVFHPYFRFVIDWLFQYFDMELMLLLLHEEEFTICFACHEWGSFVGFVLFQTLRSRLL